MQIDRRTDTTKLVVDFAILQTRLKMYTKIWLQTPERINHLSVLCVDRMILKWIVRKYCSEQSPMASSFADGIKCSNFVKDATFRDFLNSSLKLDKFIVSHAAQFTLHCKNNFTNIDVTVEVSNLNRLLLLLLLLLLFTFVQYVYNYVPEKTMFLGNTIVLMFYDYKLWYMQRYFSWQTLCVFTLVLSEVRVQCPVRLFSVVPWFRAFPVSCSVAPIIYYWYHICFDISRALYLYCKVFIFKIFTDYFLAIFLSPEFALYVKRCCCCCYYYYYYYY
jgi:hypothetical protein